MEILYLGTSAAEGIPAIFCDCSFCNYAREVGGKEIRKRSSIVIDKKLMIDYGPDVYYTTLANNIRMIDIKNIFITHSHPDHLCTSQLEYRKNEKYCITDKKENLHIFGNRAVEAEINRALNGEPEKYNIDFTFIEPYKQYEVDCYKVTPLSVVHGGQDAYIYIIEGNGKSFLYGNDTGMFTEHTFEYLESKYFNAVSLDCTMGHRDIESGHMGFNANVKIRDRLLAMGTANEDTIFISHHFSHNGLRDDNDATKSLTYKRFTENAKKYRFIMSYDGMKITL